MYFEGSYEVSPLSKAYGARSHFSVDIPKNPHGLKRIAFAPKSYGDT